MKFYTIVAWISGIIAAILMLLGAISLVLGNNLFGVRHEANYYIVASSFLLLAILCVLAHQGCSSDKKD
jgi:multisubunit Na+/H+ antiporter MnhG subunit